MNRREFLGKLGVGATVLATITKTLMRSANPTDEVKLKIDEDVNVLNHIEVSVNGSIYRIPVYTLR